MWIIELPLFFTVYTETESLMLNQQQNIFYWVTASVMWSSNCCSDLPKFSGWGKLYLRAQKKLAEKIVNLHSYTLECKFLE